MADHGAREQVVSGVAEWTRRQKDLALLWLDADYRRDFYRLVGLGLRGLMGVRLSVALLLLAAAGVYLFATEVQTAREAVHMLVRLFGGATLLAAAPIYAEDQRQGSFELLWLATGSEAAMLRLKVLTLLLGLLALMVPSVLLSAFFLDGGLPVGKTLVFLVTNALLIIAVMAYTGALLPQPWAGGLLGAAVLVGLYLPFYDAVNFFNPFLNPVGREGLTTAGGGAFSVAVRVETGLSAANRILVLAVAWLFLSAARARLRRALR